LSRGKEEGRRRGVRAIYRCSEASNRQEIKRGAKNLGGLISGEISGRR
jgi:hypothetical protein